MAWKLYVTPIIMVTRGLEAGREPKYVSDFPISWAMIDYGFQPLALVSADVDPTQDAFIAGKPETIAVPDNLDGTVGSGQVLTAVRNKLEANFVPATNWVVASTPYRAICRQISGVAMLLLRYAIITLDTTEVFAAFTLDSLFSALPAAVRTGLTNAATNLGLTLLAPTNTLRVVLRDVGVQTANMARPLGGITL
jgi:hypothetical protein